MQIPWREGLPLDRLRSFFGADHAQLYVSADERRLAFTQPQTGIFARPLCNPRLMPNVPEPGRSERGAKLSFYTTVLALSSPGTRNDGSSATRSYVDRSSPAISASCSPAKLTKLDSRMNRFCASRM